MTWLFLTLLSALGSAVTRILIKLLLKEEQSDAIAFGFAFQLLVAALLLFFTIAMGSFELPNLSGLEWNIVFMALCYGLGNIFNFYSFKYAEASEIALIFTSSVIWTVLSALLVLGERLTSAKLLGIVLIAVGVIIINFTRSRWQLNRGHLFAFCGAFLFGIAFTNDTFIIQRYHSVASFMALAFVLPAFVTLAYRPRAALKLPYFLRLSVFKKLILTAISYGVAAVSIFTAYQQGGPASVISPLAEVSVIFTIILGYFLLNERDKMLQKVLGSSLTLLGAWLLV